MSVSWVKSVFFESPEGKLHFRNASGHELIRIIGGGAYGKVWLARSVTGVYRAIKIVLRSDFKSDTPYDREYRGILRFEPISRDHEGFTDILHVGRNDGAGYFYYIMEVGDDVESGHEIDPEHYTPNTLDLQRRLHRRVPFEKTLQLALKISSALGALHEAGLVHRDIKPSNIIFVNGTPKLADIGLVTDMGLDVSFVGTEGYIPPEGPGNPPADIYSLGRSLYEVCTGNDRTEFPKLPEDLLEDSKLRPRFLDFNEILLKACDANLANRYQAAVELHAHLALLQAGESVRRILELQRLFKRFKQLAPLAAVLVIGAAVFFFLFFRERERAAVEHQRQIASAVNYGSRAVEDGDTLGALPWFVQALRLDAGVPHKELAHRLRIGSILEHSPRPVQMWHFPHRDHLLSYAEFGPDQDQILVANEDGLSGIYEIATRKLVSPLFGIGKGRDRASLSPDRRLAVLSGSEKKDIVIWDVKNNVQHLAIPTRHLPTTAMFNRDGDRVLVALGVSDAAKAWDITTGEELFALPHADDVPHATYSRDGRWIATASWDSSVGIWNASDGRLIRKIETGSNSMPNWVAFSPDGETVASAGNWRDRHVRLWKRETGELIRTFPPHGDGVATVEFSPNGEMLVSASWDSTVRIWNVKTGKPVGPPIKQTGKALHARFSADSRKVLTVSFDGFVTLWEVPSTGGSQRALPGVISGDGRVYLSATNNGVEAREMPAERKLGFVQHQAGNVRDPLPSSNGDYFLTFSHVADTNNQIEIRSYHVREGAAVGRAFRSRAGCSNAVLSADGSLLALHSRQLAEVWHVPTGRLLQSFEPGTSRFRMAFDRSGKNLAIAQKEVVRIVDPFGGKEKARRRYTHSRQMGASWMEFNHDGSKLLVAFSSSYFERGVAVVLSTVTGRSISPELKHRDGVLTARFSPDGNYIVTTSEDFDAILWDGHTFAPLPFPPLHHDDQAVYGAFSEDSKWLVTATRWGFRLWECESGEPLTLLVPVPNLVSQVEFVGGGRNVVVTLRDGTRWLYALPQERRDLKEIEAVAQLLSARAPAGATHQTDLERLMWESWIKLNPK